MECRHCGSFIATMFADTCGPGTPCAERQWTRLVHRKQAEIDRLRALLLRARKFVEDDTLMIAAITRHAPLPPDAQAIHDSTEYLSEILLREIDSVLPNGQAQPRESVG